jgi:hypothetical protein
MSLLADMVRDIPSDSYRDGFVAIELDRRSPRAGSMDKLLAFNAFRIIALRGAGPWRNERGIDAIISIPVVAA